MTSGDITVSSDMETLHSETFGQRVKRLRLKKNIRQVDLAAKAGISWRHLIRIEQDGGGAPKVATIQQLAEALGVQARELSAASDDDEEARPVPLTPDEFVMLGDLMARLGPTFAQTVQA